MLLSRCPCRWPLARRRKRLRTLLPLLVTLLRPLAKPLATLLPLLVMPLLPLRPTLATPLPVLRAMPLLPLATLPLLLAMPLRLLAKLPRKRRLLLSN